MRKATTILCSLAAATLFLTACNQPAGTAADGQPAAAEKGAIVFFNLDTVLAEYDMANDKMAVFQSKWEGINKELNTKGAKIEQDFKTLQNKYNNGYLTNSVAQVQQEKIQQRANSFAQYQAEMQQKFAMESDSLTTRILDAVNTFVQKYNEEKQYAMILVTQGESETICRPVACGAAELDITAAIVEGLNKEYVQARNEE